ncbi:hypothetical protein PV325_011275, partial [Microctonus aethiopoides]
PTVREIESTVVTPVNITMKSSHCDTKKIIGRLLCAVFAVRPTVLYIGGNDVWGYRDNGVVGGQG